MAASQKTYLELSEEGGGSHKFYEVTVAGSSVTVRYGRIGDAGQSKATRYKNPAEAAAAAAKQIAEKRRKGYAEAVMGQRERRAVSGRRTATSSGARRGTTPAPVLWKFNSGNAAFGIFVDDELCWVGNERGDVYALTHTGAVDRRYKLPDGSMCLVRDKQWLYCGCNNGNVYDLTGKIPFVAYEVNKSSDDIYWLDIHDGALAVTDCNGTITVLDHDCDLLWTKESGGSGWMVRTDKDGVYQGHDDKLTTFDWDGKKLWSKKVNGDILFGWQEPTTLYAGTTNDVVVQYTKKGTPGLTFKCDDTVYSCAAAGDGKYVFAGDSSSSVYCFDASGTRLWKLDTTCGSALSMQYFKDKLYVVTSSGWLGCIDVSEAAIASAKQGTLPTASVVKMDRDIKAASLGDALPSASASDGGVLVECYQEGGRVRVRPKAPGYKASWHVQFPRNIRTAGATYVVDGLAESSKGGFYRVVGQIHTVSGDRVARTAGKTDAKKVAKAATKTVAKQTAKKTAKKVAKAATRTAAKQTAKKVAKKVAKAATKKVAKKTSKRA